MIFKRFSPSPLLQQLIECYWIIENDDPQPHQQKIIPDGFPEIIFHYKDPYRICLHSNWEQQSMRLLGGQISGHFFLENTGASGMVGIKLKPTALTHLFNLDMQAFTDKVVELTAAIGDRLQPLEQALHATSDHETMVALIDQQLEQLLSQISYAASPVDRAVNLIFEKKGMISVAEITIAAGVGERQLERLFKKYVGLAPKFYARIIRFSTIFEYMQQGDPGWAGLAYEAGFYDQSHFIRNFKAFTGEDPSRYGFDEKNMANFFLKKKP
jgi:methylphosphotriester-DNA--protein-cysteine methyltransferase